MGDVVFVLPIFGGVTGSCTIETLRYSIRLWRVQSTVYPLCHTPQLLTTKHPPPFFNVRQRITYSPILKIFVIS
jgi:hypothetical protein